MKKLLGTRVLARDGRRNNCQKKGKFPFPTDRLFQSNFSANAEDVTRIAFPHKNQLIGVQNFPVRGCSKRTPTPRWTNPLGKGGGEGNETGRERPTATEDPYRIYVRKKGRRGTKLDI